MIIGEYFHANKSRDSTSNSCDSKISNWIFLVYQKVGLFAFGALITILMTETTKNSIGRLRPHFINVCEPDVDCQNASNINKYHDRFECKNKDRQHLWREARWITNFISLFLIAWWFFYHYSILYNVDAIFIFFSKLNWIAFRLSFLSGHAACIMYGMIFFAVSALK